MNNVEKIMDFIDKITLPSEMSRDQALELLNEISTEVDTRIEAIEEENENDDSFPEEEEEEGADESEEGEAQADAAS